MTAYRCQCCRSTRTDLPIIGICQCGSHGFRRVSDGVRDEMERGGDVRPTFRFVQEPDEEDKD